MKKHLLILPFLFCIFWSIAQNTKIDSLKNILYITQEDTSKINILNSLSWEFIQYNTDSSITYSKKALKIAQNCRWLLGISTSLRNLGTFNNVARTPSKALTLYFKALTFDEIALNLKEYQYKQKIIKAGIAKTLGNIGLTYFNQGNYPKALEYYFKAIKTDKELENKNGIARHYGNIGVLYRLKADYPKALEYFYKAKEIAQELEYDDLLATSLGNIGNIYLIQKNYSKSLEFYNQALKLVERLENYSGVATQLGNIGIIYFEQENYTEALKYYKRALSIDKKLGNKNGISRHYGNIGSLYLKQKKYADAKKYLNMAITISNEIEDIEGCRDWEQNLVILYNEIGNCKEAFKYHKLHILHRDSLLNEEKTKQTVRLEEQFKFEQEQLKIEAKHKVELLKSEADKQHQKIITYSTTVGLLLSVLFIFHIINALRTTKKQKKIIEQQKKSAEIQKQIVEQKNIDILDSIRYAKHIQNAILPTDEKLNWLLPNSFVLYLPKDIVSGDFYWLEHTETGTYIAVADCTGHGVPGALISMVCSIALTKAVVEEKITETNLILNRVREIIIEKLSHSTEQHVQDGMDICLVKIKNNSLQFSGANRPLIIIRNKEVIELSPEIQPIGITDNLKPFSEQCYTLQNQDTFYLFTDGYADQFGGEKGKKMKTSNFIKLLTSIQKNSMNKQKNMLFDAFEKWKGNFEQIDDICVIGIRIK